MSVLLAALGAVGVVGVIGAVALLILVAGCLCCCCVVVCVKCSACVGCPTCFAFRKKCFPNGCCGHKFEDEYRVAGTGDENCWNLFCIHNLEFC